MSRGRREELELLSRRDDLAHHIADLRLLEDEQTTVAAPLLDGSLPF